MHTGTQTRIGVVVPRLGSIKTTVSLSKEAKQRLKWVDYYHSHNNNARLCSEPPQVIDISTPVC